MSKLMAGQNTMFNAFVNPLGFLMPKQHQVPTQAQAGGAPGLTDPLVQDQASLATRAAGSAQGYGSTILTSGQGLPGQQQVQRKALLGG